MEATHAHGESREDADDPRRWLGASPLLDLEDPRLRLRVRALTQLCKTEREKALALYGFVKRRPFCRRVALQPRTARRVLDASSADGADKAVLLVAMLRVAGVPARIRMVVLRGELVRGLTSSVRQITRPIVEVWLNKGWQQTDTYIYDAAYLAAARERLKQQGWEWGYGIHVAGDMLWSGLGSAFVAGRLGPANPMLVADLGLYHDPGEYLRARGHPAQRVPLARSIYLSILAPAIQRAILALRRGPTRAAALDDSRRTS